MCSDPKGVPWVKLSQCEKFSLSLFVIIETKIHIFFWATCMPLLFPLRFICFVASNTYFFSQTWTGAAAAASEGPSFSSKNWRHSSWNRHRVIESLSHWNKHFMLSHSKRHFMLRHWIGHFMLRHWRRHFISNHWKKHSMLSHWNRNFMLSHWNRPFMLSHWKRYFMLSHWNRHIRLKHTTSLVPIIDLYPICFKFIRSSEWWLMFTFIREG